MRAIALRGGLMLAFLIGACGGEDDGAATVEPGNIEGSIAFEEATLVWAFDDEPLGETLDYSEGIEQDRLDAGWRW